MVSLTFLPSETPIKASRRDVELSRSSAKAHLARLYHQRRLAEIQASKLLDTVPKTSESNAHNPTDLSQQTKKKGKLRSSPQEQAKNLLSAADERTGHLLQDHAVSDVQLSMHGSMHEQQSIQNQIFYEWPETSDILFSETLDLRKPDPYATVYDGLADYHTMELLHHCRTGFWPGFAKGSATFHVPPFAFNFGAIVQQGPALFHALIWQSAVNLNFQTKKQITHPSSLKHYQMAIQSIAKDIEKPVQAISDSTMYAMLSLTVPEVPFMKEQRISSQGFQPPLAQLSWIHLFSRSPVVESHSTALFRLIDLKGGINCLTMRGFAASINYMDLIRASQKLCRPHFELSRICGDIRTRHTRISFFDHATKIYDPTLHCEAVEESFPAIDKLIQFGLSQELREVILDLRIWVRVSAKYEDKTIVNPDFSLTAFHRDLVQRDLLHTIAPGVCLSSKPAEASKKEAGPSSSIDVSSMVQTGLLIFSVGVTFPITHAPTFQLLTHRLWWQLRQNMAALQTANLHDLLIWLCMLGCLCAIHVSEEGLRSWYVNTICDIESSVNARERRIELDIEGIEPSKVSNHKAIVARPWKLIKEFCLQPLVWSETACDFGGEIIWEEVMWQVNKRNGRDKS